MAAEAGPRYRVLDKLGQGGMGIVFRAEDRLLRRQVALKLVGEQQWPQGKLREHLLNEARASAGLNHPNVCTVYDVGEWAEAQPSDPPGLGETIAAGTPYIAMELVQGRPLSAVLAAEPLKLPELLDYSVQIADGLAEAHSRRIVHRDLKPHNVMVCDDGRVKILDFGLAAAETAEGPADLDTRASTLSVHLGGERAIRGTVPYMSPEQAAGRQLDSRSDVFSFGVMLYEMASGQRPFRGDSVTTVLAKILEAQPEPLGDLRPQLPEELARIVHRCLEKKPKDRYNDTRDLLADLKQLRVAVSSSSTRRRPAPVRKRPKWLVPGLAIVAGLSLAGLAVVVLTRTLVRPPPLPPKHTQVTFTGSAYAATLAPDGRFMSYQTAAMTAGAPAKVMVQEIGGGQAIPVLEGLGLWEARWSPDGSELLVPAFDVAGQRGTFLVPRLGGTARRFDSTQVLAWSPDGSRFATLGSSSGKRSLRLIHKLTGEKTVVQLPNPSDNPAAAQVVVGIDWAPSGRWLVYYSYEGQRALLWTIPTGGGQSVKIAEDTAQIFSPHCSPRGDAVYYTRGAGRTNELWKVPVSPATGVPRGAARVVSTGLEGAQFTISGDGKRLLYTKGTDYSNLWFVPLRDSASRKPTTRQMTSGTALDDWPSVSPDGTRVAFRRESNETSHIFVMPVEGGDPRQVTFLGSTHLAPAWSPDGREIAYVSCGAEDRECQIWTVGADGGAPHHFARARAASPSFLAWTPGARILYNQRDRRNVTVLDPQTEQETPLLKEDWDGTISEIYPSRDGSRVALTGARREGARFRMIFQIASLDTGKLTVVAEDPGQMIDWAPDGKGFFALALDGLRLGRKLLLLPLRGGPPRTAAMLPAELALNRLAMLPDGSGFVSDVQKTVSDAWLIDNFDPDVR